MSASLDVDTSGDGQEAWRQAQAILDRMAEHQGLLRLRSTPFPVTWSGGEALFQVQGHLLPLLQDHDGPLDPSGDSYCTTCPFREDDCRTERLRHHLEHPEAG